MPFVRRNENGKIDALSKIESSDFNEFLSLNHPDVAGFLSAIDRSGQAKSALRYSDQVMSRVIDDLVNLLIRKQVIRFTDLPEEVKQKLEIGNRLRENSRIEGNPIVSEQDLL